MLYTEVPTAVADPTLMIKVRVACVISAQNVFVEVGTTTNHTNRLLWAKATMSDPVGAGNRMMYAVVAQNIAATLAAVLGATDAAVLTAVAAAIDLFANGS